MHWLLANTGIGYAVVNTDSAMAAMTSSGFWRKATLHEFLEYRDGVDRYGLDLRYFIRADGRYATATNTAAAEELLGQDFYEAEQEDYDLFVKRQSLGKAKYAPWQTQDTEEEPDDDVDQ